MSVLAHLFGRGKPKGFLLDLCKFFAVELSLPITMVQLDIVVTNESMLYAAKAAFEVSPVHNYLLIFNKLRHFCASICRYLHLPQATTSSWF